MSATRATHPEAASLEIPPVPLTVEGYSVLHQMMRFRWTAWRPLPAGEEARNRARGQQPCSQRWSRIHPANLRSSPSSDTKAT